ncbi:hypothetical protein CRYUN_Cryun06bG0099300 [Craigia yunnanensis]
MDYGMETMVEYYGCMDDLLGLAGFLYEAFELVDKRPTRLNAIIWRILLGACVKHNECKLALKVKERIYKLNPNHDGDYVLLSNAWWSW